LLIKKDNIDKTDLIIKLNDSAPAIEVNDKNEEKTNQPLDSKDDATNQARKPGQDFLLEA